MRIMLDTNVLISAILFRSENLSRLIEKVYARIVGRTDYNAGYKATGIPDTHYHGLYVEAAT